jgi:hypothetical protein
MTVEPAIAISLVTLVVSPAVIEFLAWRRESRLRKWAKTDAETKAKTDEAAAKALALKVSNDIVAAAAESNAKAAAVAAEVVAEAARVSQTAILAAKELAEKVANNTEISSKAVDRADGAFTEANSQNSKIIKLGDLIADLNKQVVMIVTHLKESDAATKEAADEVRRAHEFNVMVKGAVEEKLAEMNGHTPQARKKRK